LQGGISLCSPQIKLCITLILKWNSSHKNTLNIKKRDLIIHLKLNNAIEFPPNNSLPTTDSYRE
jgi:hypothetical protein